MLRKFLISLTVLIPLLSFGQKKVANYYSVKGYTETTAKQYFDYGKIDAMEGIWQSSDGFKYSIEKDVSNGTRVADRYRIIILSHNTNNPFWKETYVKGFIDKTAVSGAYNIDYYSAGQNYYGQMDILIETCLGVLESSALFTFTRQSGEKILLIRLYPKTTEGNQTFNDDELPKGTGTGFAISSNGYIVTNHHVIENAKTIDVKGINGNFNRKYSADIIVNDERNDLAIIKINDPSFSSLGQMPYSFRNNIADVGENVFVLGYPMTTTMGEEIKLTNGIISSKTGYQGDISTYQISAPIQPGNSGGPLFDKTGNIIGVVNAKHTKAENAGYAIKTNYLKNLIDLLPSPVILSGNLLSGKSLSEQVKIASNYVYLIEINTRSTPSNPSSNSGNKNYNQTNSREDAIDFFKQAQEEWKNKNYSSAISLMNKSISSDPTMPESYGFRGFVYLYGTRNFDEAISDFTKLIQMKPSDKNAYYYRASAYRQLKKHSEAVMDLSEYIKSNPDNLDAYFIRALSKSEIGDRYGAINDYDEIIKREKKAKDVNFLMGTVYNNKGYCYVELGDYKAALPLLNKALDLSPDETYIWGSRGELYYKTGEYEKCIKDMNKAIDLEEKQKSKAPSQDRGVPFLYRGLSKIKLGRKGEGCLDLSKASELGNEDSIQAIKENCK